MAILLLFSLFIRCLNGSLLLRHLLHLRFELVLEDLNLVLKRKDVLIFSFESHLQRHHLVLDVIPLRFERIHNMALGLLYFVL